MTKELFETLTLTKRRKENDDECKSASQWSSLTLLDRTVVMSRLIGILLTGTQIILSVKVSWLTSDINACLRAAEEKRTECFLSHIQMLSVLLLVIKCSRAVTQ